MRKIIEIECIDDVKDSLSNLGDLREEGESLVEYQALEDDDLGFYQQACEYLLNFISTKEKDKK